MATSRSRNQRRWDRLRRHFRRHRGTKRLASGRRPPTESPQKPERERSVNRASSATEFQQPVYKEPEKKPVVIQRPVNRQPEHEVKPAWRPDPVMEPLPRPSPTPTPSPSAQARSGSPRVLTDKKSEPVTPPLGYTTWQLILNALLKVSSKELNCEELRDATLGANDSGPNAFRDAVVFLKKKDQITVLGLKAGGRLSKSVRIRRVGFLSYDALLEGR